MALSTGDHSLELELFEEVTKMIDEPPAMVHIDLSKAFDKSCQWEGGREGGRYR